MGPRIFSLVKCKACGEQYNGKSGRCVKKAIKVYTWVTMGVLAMVAAWAMYSFIADKQGPGTEKAHPIMHRTMG